MKGSLVEAQRCYQHQISDQLEQIHRQIIADLNPNHLCGTGWIACPYGADITEEQAGQLFDRLGGWGHEKLELRSIA